eukprot:CAMPEP_0203896466 /NCGR_PEP_ID=MMETSP0359-20131031/39184_1 /ASSEMBLY_ACC=CAM_ASM_000338 /TAXON_ID=268821 /ORGANISM="Scrippsiella Hangoei, Strain SHTV-5" /LENGTH=84 /DNA_ID=CAMNT_0050819127 /DNA_START=41 /DNA_END=295 /DNA_ORIENTATION=+
MARARQNGLENERQFPANDDLRLKAAWHADQGDSSEVLSAVHVCAWWCALLLKRAFSELQAALTDASGGPSPHARVTAKTMYHT